MLHRALEYSRENKGISTELLRPYLKNANLSNSSEDIRLLPKGRRGRGRPPMRLQDQSPDREIGTDQKS
jgi:hypothetical protein